MISKAKSIIVLFIIFSCLSPTKIFANNPDLIVQYHAWYDTPYGPESSTYPRSARENDGILWGLWDTRRAEGSNQGSPDVIRADGWSRTSIATPTSYPLIGLYDPDDPEILHWHIKLAKAAGIKAFAISAYAWTDALSGKTEVSLESKRLVEIFRKFLEIARQENFQLAWEYWWGGPTDFTQYRDIFNHPNYYRVGGKPMFWVAPNVAPYNYFGNNITEFDAIATQIESQLGQPLYWALSANHPNMDTTQSTKSVIAMTTENIRSANSTNLWANEIGSYHTSHPDKLIGTHIYPGFNDSILTRRHNPKIYSRYDGSTLQSALQASLDINADFIFLESWNDFSEGTAIEPGLKEDNYSDQYFTNQDYYKDLRLIAQALGKNFTPPPLPPITSVDPLVRTSQLYPTKPGDLNLDNTINLLDFSLLISNFGNSYTIFDFNSIVTNYGK